jgi:hypothetical protein
LFSFCQNLFFLFFSSFPKPFSISFYYCCGCCVGAFTKPLTMYQIYHTLIHSLCCNYIALFHTIISSTDLPFFPSSYLLPFPMPIPILLNC